MQLARGGAVRKYLRVAEISLTNRLAYLADHLVSSIFLILILFIFSQLWKTVLGTEGQIAGLDSTRMLWYMVFTEVIALSTPGTHSLVSEEVKSGDIAYKLVRPYSYILYYFSSHCGEYAVRFVTNLLVGSAFAYLAMGPLAVPLAKLGWVLLGLALAAAINFLVSFSGGLLAGGEPALFLDPQQDVVHFRRSLYPGGGLSPGPAACVLPAAAALQHFRPGPPCGQLRLCFPLAAPRWPAGLGAPFGSFGDRDVQEGGAQGSCSRRLSA